MSNFAAPAPHAPAAPVTSTPTPERTIYPDSSAGVTISGQSQASANEPNYPNVIYSSPGTASVWLGIAGGA